MTTPASIKRLTGHAVRAKGLMADTEKAGPEAERILDDYESAFGRFKAGLSEVKENTKELEAALKVMGNASEVLGDAFRPESSSSKPPPPPPPPTPPLLPVVEPKGPLLDGGAPKSGEAG